MSGAGGIEIRSIAYTDRFKSDYKGQSSEIKACVNDVLRKLMQHPMPRSLRFEKLNGFKNPSIYTIHVTSNRSHKLSMSIVGDRAELRRVGTHKEIDRAP